MNSLHNPKIGKLTIPTSKTLSPAQTRRLNTKNELELAKKVI